MSAVDQILADLAPAFAALEAAEVLSVKASRLASAATGAHVSDVLADEIDEANRTAWSNRMAAKDALFDAIRARLAKEKA